MRDGDRGECAWEGDAKPANPPEAQAGPAEAEADRAGRWPSLRGEVVRGEPLTGVVLAGLDRLRGPPAARSAARTDARDDGRSGSWNANVDAVGGCTRENETGMREGVGPCADRLVRPRLGVGVGVGVRPALCRLTSVCVYSVGVDGKAVAATRAAAEEKSGLPMYSSSPGAESKGEDGSGNSAASSAMTDSSACASGWDDNAVWHWAIMLSSRLCMRSSAASGWPGSKLLPSCAAGACTSEPWLANEVGSLHGVAPAGVSATTLPLNGYGLELRELRELRDMREHGASFPAGRAVAARRRCVDGTSARLRRLERYTARVG